MTDIHIVVGTVMGTAAEVARSITDTLEKTGHQVEITLDYRPDDWQPHQVLLVCTSNTGMGDLPANIAPFYEHLKRDYPNIAGRKYGVVNLGDSSYPNFAQAGRTLDETLADLGAQRIGEPFVMDACMVSDYQQEATEWAAQWAQLL